PDGIGPDRALTRNKKSVRIQSLNGRIRRHGIPTITRKPRHISQIVRHTARNCCWPVPGAPTVLGVSSSGLIYAVIVGAWAAYLVPMWLRRQDELNEARPTERFSTAIRLLSGRAGMERRYAKDLQARSTEEGEA